MKIITLIATFFFILFPFISNAQQQDPLQDLHAPKIIKNNVRLEKINITKSVKENGYIQVEGSIEIKNYANTRTSKLFLANFLGIKDGSYYLKYPIYNDSRSEEFYLEPNELVIKDFKIVQQDITMYGTVGLEAWLIDEYEKRVHAKVITLGNEALTYPEDKKPIFSNFLTALTNNVIEAPLVSGLTYFPEKEDLFIKVKFKDEQSITIKNAEVKIYNRNFFTSPLQSFKQEVNETYKKDSMLSIQIPENLPSGVYPFEVSLTTNNTDTLIPKLYGRFIVGGNMNKVLDVVLNETDKKVENVTLVVQGNPQNIATNERDQSGEFNVMIQLLDKKGKILAEHKLEKQSVDIYKNIEVVLSEKIKTNKIDKAYVELSNEKGVFDSYEKEFIHKKEFNYFNLLWIVLIAGIIGFLIFIKIRKNKLNVISAGTVMFLFFIPLISHADITPTPYKDFGVYRYDGFDLNFYSNLQYNCVSCGGGVNDNEPIVRANDIDVKKYATSTLLEIFGINLVFDEPVFFDQNPNVCYTPGDIIPVALNYTYGISGASPIACPNGSCLEEYTPSIETYSDIYISSGWGNWYWNLRGWEVDTAHIDDPLYYGSSMVDLSFDNFKDLDLDYVSNYVSQLENQSLFDYLITNNVGVPTSANSLEIVNINEERIFEITQKILQPFSAIGYDHREISLAISNNSVGGTHDYSLVAPEKPGIYPLTLSMRFEGIKGEGYYIAQNRIKVCDAKHDADILMSGKQYVDVDGTLKDEDGSPLEGYTVQQYPIEPDIIEADGVEIAGFNDSPFNEFSFVTVANYCGYKESYVNAYGTDFSTNSWLNYYTNGSNLSNKLGWEPLSYFLSDMPELNKTKIPVIGHYTNGARYFATTGTTTNNSITLKDYQEEYIVHKVGEDLKFIDLFNVSFPRYDAGGYTIDNAFSLADLGTIPGFTFSQMLSNGKFDYGSYISSAQNNTSNTFLIKENITRFGNTTSCSLYEDFCSGVSGVQYLRESGTKMELYTILNGVHVFASSTAYNSPVATVDAMCAVVPTSNFAASCSVESPATANDRNPNDTITFAISTTGGDGVSPITYSWTGAGPLVDQSKATTSYATTGTKNNVSVQVTQNGNIANVSCPVDIVSEPMSLSCVANPVSYTLQQNETNHAFTFTSSANQTISSYQWKNAGGTVLGTGPTLNRTYTEGSNTVYLYATSTLGAANNTSCTATVYPYNIITNNPLINTFKFNPEIVSNINESCKLYLDADDVTQCRLVNTLDDASINFATTSVDAININGTENIGLGTWNLKCTGTGINANEQTLSSQKCILNPNYREN